MERGPERGFSNLKPPPFWLENKGAKQGANGVPKGDLKAPFGVPFGCLWSTFEIKALHLGTFRLHLALFGR